MKLENKRKAQAERAKKRKKQETLAKIKKMIWIPILALILIFTVFIIVDGVSNKSGNTAQTEESQTAAETKTADGAETEEESDEGDQTVKDGDTVNIDYIGYVDGVEFNGGNTKGAGADLVIGSGTYIDDFEEQLIGHKVGDTFDIEVTFPDGYGDTTTVDGDTVTLDNKDVVFTVTINSIN